MLSGLSLILLAYNEERNLGIAIEHARAAGKKYARKHEVIASVYAGSKDKTLEVARSYAKKYKDVRVVEQPADKRGYGIGLQMGIDAAKLDYVFYTDADNQFNLDEIGRLVPFCERYDIVSGYRKKRDDPFGRVVSAKFYNFGLRLLFGLHVKDVDSAFKIYNRKIFKPIRIESVQMFTDAEILLKAKKHRFTLREVPVHHFRRKEGQSDYGTGLVPRKLIWALFKEMWQLRRSVK